MKKFLKGRANLSTTVYVPFDCKNNCKFCPSKKLYSQRNKSIVEVEESLRKMAFTDIQEFVFTGGEPFSNLELLKSLVDLVNNKTVYINTTMPNFPNIVEIVDYINNQPNIMGINISRHYGCIEKDRKILNNITDDYLLKFIKKPKKINVVLENDNVSIEDLASVIERWEGFSNTTVCFRKNFNNSKEENLHSFNDPMIEKFLQLGNYQGKTMCNVCDSMNFISKDGVKFTYHRGLPTTSIQLGEQIEVNDVIIFPDGRISYDWTPDKELNTNQKLEEFFKSFEYRSVKSELYIDNSQLKVSTIQSSYNPNTSFSLRASCGGLTFGRC